MSSSKRSPRTHLLGVVALLAFVLWFGLSLKFPPAAVTVPPARLAVYVLPVVAFLVGHRFAAANVRRFPRLLDVVPSVAAGATLLAATQLPRVGIVIDDWQASSLLAFCTVLALWAGTLAHQVVHHLLTWRRPAAAFASAAGLLGAMGMWIGLVPGTEGLVRHGLLCLVAALVVELSRVGGAWWDTALVLSSYFAAFVTLHTVQPDPGVWRPAALAFALLVTGGAGRAWVVRQTRLLLVCAAIVAAAYAQLVASGPTVVELMAPRIGLAAICGMLLAAAAANQATARDRTRPAAEREASRQRALTALLGFVLLATPWMVGMNWPWLWVGAGLLLVTGLITTRS